MGEPKSGSGFAALFEEQNKNAKRARDVHVGDRLDVTITKLGREAAFVELEGQRQAFIDALELRAPDGTWTVKVGDRLTVQVVEVNRESGEIRLGRSAGRPGNIAALEQAREAGIAVEGKVAAANKGGLEVDLDGMRGFCPFSQADVRFVEDPTQFVGRTFRFLVTEIRDGGKKIVLSRRAVLEQELRFSASRLMATLTPGTVTRGTVTSVRDFGAFVDLGGVEGLIPVSELSHDRVGKPSDVVSVGDLVEVQILDVKDAPVQRSSDLGLKITLSLKSLAADPWEAIDVVAPIGKVMTGTVTRTAEFGVFVRLAAGIEGLLHVSELGGKQAHPSRMFSAGQTLRVVVQRADREAKKLSLVPAPDDLEPGAAVNAVNVAVGAIVEGVVDRIENYGVFVQLQGTKGRAGRGLIPNAELGTPRGADTRKHFREGTSVRAKVLETGEGRLRLSIRGMKDDEERADWDGYRSGTGAPARLGTLGDLLKKKSRV